MIPMIRTCLHMCRGRQLKIDGQSIRGVHDGRQRSHCMDFRHWDYIWNFGYKLPVLFPDVRVQLLYLKCL